MNIKNEIQSLYTADGRINTAIVRRQSFKDSELFKAIMDLTSFLEPECSLNERLFCIHNDITEIELCEVCGKDRKKYHPSKKGVPGKYSNTCKSRSCSHRHKSVVDKRNDTLMRNYGSLASDKQRGSARSRSEELNRKGRQTLRERHGVDNPSQLLDHSAKCKQTLMDRYGVDHPSRIESIKGMRYSERLDFYSNIGNVDVINIEDGIGSGRITYECSCGHKETIPTETFKYRGRSFDSSCTKCSGIIYGSHAQEDIAKFIESFGIKIVRNDRSVLDGLEIDIFIPSLNLGIEYNGIYWHSYDSAETTEQKNRHLRKTEKARDVGVKLIQVFESEYLNKRDIVLSRIKSAIGINDVLYARKCVVKTVSAKDARSFLEANHIQGADSSSIRFGLYSQGELSALMTFGKSRFDKKHDYELIRYCSKKGLNVVGGAGKLLKAFRKNYNGSIISYADKRWSDGNLYNALGFNHIRDSKPGYFYYDKSSNGLELLNRQQFQKHKLRDVLDNFNETLSESENMFANGYRRIWDCGNFVFSLE